MSRFSVPLLCQLRMSVFQREKLRAGVNMTIKAFLINIKVSFCQVQRQIMLDVGREIWDVGRHGAWSIEHRDVISNFGFWNANVKARSEEPGVSKKEVLSFWFFILILDSKFFFALVPSA